MAGQIHKYKLGDVCKIYQPKTISTELLVDNGKYLVYGANGVIGRYDDYNHEGRELLLTCRGATCGRINVSEPYSWINGNAMVIHPIIPDVCFDFFKYLLEAQDWSQSITGAAQPQITRQSIAPILVALPPLPEQESIVKELDLLSGIIEKKKQQLKELDNLAQSIFYEMFGDLLTNPYNFSRLPLKELGELARGVSKHRPRNASELLGGDMPLIQTGDVANAGMYINKFSSTYSELGVAQSRVWEKGTLCITIAANIGKCAILTFKACFPDSVVGFRPNDEKALVSYMYFVFSSLQKLLEDTARGVAQKNINLATLNALMVPTPPLSLQQSFAQKIEAIERQKELIKQSIKETETLFNSRMDYYFN